MTSHLSCLRLANCASLADERDGEVTFLEYLPDARELPAQSRGLGDEMT